MSWHPNRAQWWAIWIFAVPAALLWIGAAGPHDPDINRRIAIALIVVGLLVVWRLAKPTT